jgi:hypothetical protein
MLAISNRFQNNILQARQGDGVLERLAARDRHHRLLVLLISGRVQYAQTRHIMNH